MAEKSHAFQNFQDNLRDAELLLEYARAFRNGRKRAMRRELREKVGEALDVAVKRRDELDCMESDDLFVLFKPDGQLSRDSFGDLTLLLRSSLVAGCAALETYIADYTISFAGQFITNRELPPRFKDINLTLGQWIEVEEYTRRGSGIKNLVVTPYIKEVSSTAPNNIGKLLAIINLKDWAKRVDMARKVESGTTVKDLDEVTERRNLIVHTADRKGRGRGSLKPDEIAHHLNNIKSIVNALESVLGSHKVQDCQLLHEVEVQVSTRQGGREDLLDEGILCPAFADDNHFLMVRVSRRQRSSSTGRPEHNPPASRSECSGPAS